MKVKGFFLRFRWYQWLIFAIAVAINVFIIVNSCLPGKESTEASGWLVTLLKNIVNGIKADTITEENIGPFTSFVRKMIGHFSLFMVSGFFTTLSIKFLYLDKKEKFMLFIIFTCISGLFLALLTEFIQRFVPGRSGEILDVLIDFSGYLLAVLILGIIIYFQINKTSDVENKE